MRKFPICLSFTPKDCEVLLDRLSIPDCIAECFLDTHPDDPPCEYTWEEVEDAASKLEDMIDDLGCVILESDVECDVLIDAVEGSTMPSKMKDAFDEGAITAGQYNKYKRVFRAIERKMAAAGLEAKFL